MTDVCTHFLGVVGGEGEGGTRRKKEENNSLIQSMHMWEGGGGTKKKVKVNGKPKRYENCGKLVTARGSGYYYYYYYRIIPRERFLSR